MKGVYTITKTDKGRGLYRNLTITVYVTTPGEYATYSTPHLDITWQSDNDRTDRVWVAWYAFEIKTDIRTVEQYKALAAVAKALTDTESSYPCFIERPADVITALNKAGFVYAEREHESGKMLQVGEHYIADVREWGHIVTSNGRTEAKARASIIETLNVKYAQMWAADGFPMARVAVNDKAINNLLDPTI